MNDLSPILLLSLGEEGGERGEGREDGKCLMSECGESGEIHFIIFDDDDDDDDACKNVPFRRECERQRRERKMGWGWWGVVDVYIF
jgi:hypothetical protein